MNNPPHWILPVIVLAQFCCTALWFAGNAVLADLVRDFGLETSALGHITAAVQFGFITGTLIFAVLTIADRFSPSKVFLVSAVAGAVFNLGAALGGQTLVSLLFFRFLTGFFLAGIYPVGMKIAADYYQKGLGKSLGFLVGALVLGTAFPHLLKGFSGDLPWRFVLILTSGLAVVGGLTIALFVPDGPHRKPGTKPDFGALFRVFSDGKFRSAAFGYFGHMWELYAFWAFVPVMLKSFNLFHTDARLNVPVLSFLIIGCGGLACVAGGYISERLGAKRTAGIALFASGLCCLISPLLFFSNSGLVFTVFLLFWGLVVIADSPLFSSLVAHNAPAESKGTALTIVNCIGFAITIVSIQLLNFLYELIDPRYIYLILAPGPALGLWAMFAGRRNQKMQAEVDV
ncbi:MAG: MFS transporter [Lewinellaceae bacterium]|nr:MFS transporter [Lewinellaceae bacterium]